MARKIFGFTLCLIFLLFPTSAFAAEDWIIDSFDSQVAIQEDGKVGVAETIDVNFGTLLKHGIYRDIPYIYYTDKEKNIYTAIEVQSILEDGEPAQYQTSKTGNFVRLKIGSANKTISGRHRYTIEYAASGVLRSFSDYDELYWDVTGNGWPVPITKAQATVTLPQAGVVKTACFAGAFGSTETCNSRIVNRSTALFVSRRPLGEQEGLTLVLAYTAGMVPIIIVPPPPPSYGSSGSTLYGPDSQTFWASLLVSSGLVFLLWWKKGREQSSGRDAVVVEYFPPDKLRPAEVGTILDERADTLDVSATIIDLAARGFMTIAEIPKKWLFGSTDYILTETGKDPGTLLSYETELLDRIFEGSDEIKLSELKEEFYDDLVDVKASLYKNVVDKGFFPVSPERVKTLYGFAGVAIFGIGLMLGFFGLFESSGRLGGVGLGLLFSGILLLILSRSFARRTKAGHELYRKILGFKLFVEKAEKYQQQFLERKNIFSEVLPYAIVFGVTEKFAKAFKDLGIKPNEPSWYVSSRPFNAVLFSSHINSFSSSLSSAIASQPRSNSFASSGSGFSSGGGSSGGGFGGGGGGSW